MEDSFDGERIAAADGMRSSRFTRHPNTFHLGIISALSEIDKREHAATVL
jgi:hypothetical protein